MYEEKIVLCGANSYEEKYYLNPDFEALPDSVKDELKIMCVLYVNDVGGILTLVYDEDGEPRSLTRCLTRLGAGLRSSNCRERKKSCSQHCRCIIKCFFLEGIYAISN